MTNQTALMKPKSPSYNQQHLKAISDAVCDRIEELLDVLHIDYKLYDKMATMSCPIHGGDNTGACNLYHIGDSYRGNWKCRTHNCQDVFKSSIIGFIRGCLSHRKYNWQNNGDKTCSFNEAIQFIQQFLGNKIDINSLSVIDAKVKDKNDFVNTVRYITESSDKDKLKISKDYLLSKISVPSEYFLGRGFSKAILSKYYVGDCYDDTKEMYNRAVVPIFDDNNEYIVGCTGRSLFEKCSKCKAHHDPRHHCPNEAESWKYSKWKHSSGFKSGDNVYNIWAAKQHIKTHNNTVILVESPGNVWRLEEAGIHNAVAIFGTTFTDRQKMIVDCSGAMDIITIMDNDEAGHQAREKIYTKCKKTYNVTHIDIPANDIASMSIEEIKKLNII
jgi:5S rRNA maturation endonuclease (ribonuclease M5)